MYGLAQLVDQRISLHDVAVSAGVERRDGRVQGGERGHQKKKRPRGNFLGEFEKVDSTLAGHSNVGNDDVKDLRFELAPGGFHAMYHFNAVTFLSEGDLQQLADGFLVVDNENMGHFTPRFLHCGFRSLHSASRNSRQFNNKLRAAVFFRNHTDPATVRLDDLIDDGEAQACAAFKTGLKRLKNLGSLPGVEADAGVAEGDAQPEGMLFELHGESAAIRHRPQGVIAEIPEDLLDLVGVHPSAHLVPIERAVNLVFRADFRFFFHEHQGFIQEIPDVGFLKFIAFFSGIIEEVGDDIVQTLGFPADNVDEMLLVFLERHEPCELLDGAGHGRERLANLVSDSGREAAQGGHAFLGRDFLLQSAQLGQVLKVEDIAAALRIPSAQRRNTDSQIAPLAGGCAEVYLFSKREPFRVGILAGQPEIFVQILQFLAVQLGEAESENFLAGAVQQQDAAAEVCGDESAAHRVNDVFREILQAEKLFAFLLQLPSFAAKRLGEQTGQIGDRQKTEKVDNQPGAQTLGSRRARVSERNSPGVGKKGHASKEDEAGRGDQEGDSSREQNTRDDNHQQVERDEIALLQAGGIDQ